MNNEKVDDTIYKITAVYLLCCHCDTLDIATWGFVN